MRSIHNNNSARLSNSDLCAKRRFISDHYGSFWHILQKCMLNGHFGFFPNLKTCSILFTSVQYPNWGHFWTLRPGHGKSLSLLIEISNPWKTVPRNYATFVANLFAIIDAEIATAGDNTNFHHGSPRVIS